MHIHTTAILGHLEQTVGSFMEVREIGTNFRDRIQTSPGTVAMRLNGDGFTITIEAPSNVFPSLEEVRDRFVGQPLNVTVDINPMQRFETVDVEIIAPEEPGISRKVIMDDIHDN